MPVITSNSHLSRSTQLLLRTWPSVISYRGKPPAPKKPHEPVLSLLQMRISVRTAQHEAQAAEVRRHCERLAITLQHATVDVHCITVGSAHAGS
jgi:hypothetical protein